VGYSADLIVLDRNIFAIPSQDISETRVLCTLFKGREVWRDASW
jgi:predicted amidohydrolase YtcJ